MIVVVGKDSHPQLKCHGLSYGLLIFLYEAALMFLAFLKKSSGHFTIDLLELFIYLIQVCQVYVFATHSPNGGFLLHFPDDVFLKAGIKKKTQVQRSTVLIHI